MTRKHVAIYGPPGTGKTTDLIRRAELHVAANEPVLIISHTKAAAEEAQKRITARGHSPKNIVVGTCHSIAYRAAGITSSQVIQHSDLKEFGDSLALPINGGSMDSGEGIDVGDECLAILQLSRARQTDVMAEFEDSHRPVDLQIFKNFVAAYVSWKGSNGWIDFADMLDMYPEGKAIYAGYHIIVDEAQDFSKAQWSCLERIAEGAASVTIAGDDDQAIYTWGGADPAGMVRFEEAKGAERVILKQSYRVPEKIHALSQKLIGRIDNRVKKRYRPNSDDGTITRHGRFESVEFDGRETLVLYRNHSVRKEIERHLIYRNIPYLTLSGFPGPLQNKYARAIRAVIDMNTHGSPDENARRAIKACLKPRFKKTPAKQLFKMPWDQLLEIPGYLMQYYRRVDHEEAPMVTLSTIHGSKGREAERVVVCNEVTQRVWESMDRDPDPEVRVFYVAITRAKSHLDIVEGDRGFDI